MRVRLELAYDGSGFAGWARQPTHRTVQGDLERALSTVLRLPAVVTTCAGRTDAGVHARGQVVHVDLPASALEAARARSAQPWPQVLVRRVNRLLAADVRVRGCAIVPDDFDARFAALWRRYAYRVSDHAGGVDPLRRGHVLSWPRQLDLDAMDAAAAHLMGEHDFVAFCRPRQGASTVRELQQLRWRRDGDGVAVLDVRADAFCHRMVRALAGVLLGVGEGRRPVEWPGQVLRARRRDPAVLVVPAHGLTLEEVGYPPRAELGERVRVTRRARVCGR